MPAAEDVEFAHASRIEQMLTDGDRRTVGEAGAVAGMVIRSPMLMGDLVACLSHASPAVRMRAADALEKATRNDPRLLAPFRGHLLQVLSTTRQQEVQWHLAQIMPRLALELPDVVQVTDVLAGWVDSSPSSIVRVMCLQALADLALQGRLPVDDARATIAPYAGEGNTPSVRSRARKLVKQLSGS